jgi:acetylglutamate kinase
VNPAILLRLLAEELIPVVSTIGADLEGQSYNINADTVASAIAVSLQAEKLLYLTDIEGLLADVDDPASLISSISASELRTMIAEGTLRGGMIPKIEGCLQAVDGGVRRAHILDGRVPHVVLLEIFSDAGIGTMISPGAPT